jgi:hypothetical protein
MGRQRTGCCAQPFGADWDSHPGQSEIIHLPEKRATGPVNSFKNHVLRPRDRSGV